MLSHRLSTLRCTVALFLILAALLIATVTPAIMGQPETKSYTIFEGSNPWYAASIRQTNAGAVQGQAIAYVFANHNFDAIAGQP